MLFFEQSLEPSQVLPSYFDLKEERVKAFVKKSCGLKKGQHLYELESNQHSKFFALSKEDLRLESEIRVRGSFELASKLGLGELKGERVFLIKEVLNNSRAVWPKAFKSLASYNLGGIRPETLERLETKFGDEITSFILDEEEQLLKLKLIPPNQVLRLKSLLEFEIYKRPLIELLDREFKNFTQDSKDKLLARRDSLKLLRDNPWELVRQNVLSFGQADQAARQFKIKLFHYQRLRLLFERAASENRAGSGDVYSTKSQILTAMKNYQKGQVYKHMTEEEKKYLPKVLDRILKDPDVKAIERRGELVYTLESLSSIEDRIADLLIKLSKRKIKMEKPLDESQLIGLSEGQKLAVKTFYEAPLMLLQGVPGAGKTTVVKRSLLASGAKEEKTVLLAPTAKAAGELKEKTGYKRADTIHKRLLLDPDTGISKGLPFEEDFVVIDESSMLTQNLLLAILERVGPKTKVLFVGDPEQLPAIGEGKVFSDMLDSNVLKKVALTKVFRQKGESSIKENAKRIRECRTDLKEADDFLIYDEEDPVKIEELIKDLYLKEVSKQSKDEVALILPHRQKDKHGTEYFNLILRDLVNPDRGDDSPHGFRPMDTLINTRNRKVTNHKMEEIYLANGERLLFLGRSPEGKNFLSLDDDRFSLVDEEMELFSLCQSITVHRSQGSEYKTVIFALPLELSDYFFLDKNAVYTAITRAKEKFIFVGKKKVLTALLQKEAAKERKTLLKEALIKRSRA